MSLSAVNFLNKTSCSRNRRVSDADIDSGITCRDPNTRWETSATTSVLPPVSLSERLLDLACRDETFQAVSCMSCAVFNSYILLAGVQPYALIMIVGFFATFLFGLLLNLYIQCDQDTALDSQAFHETETHELTDSGTWLRKANDEANAGYDVYEHAGYEIEDPYNNYSTHDMYQSLSQLSLSSSGSTQDFE